MKALQLGITLGIVIELARKLIRNHRHFKDFSGRSRSGRATAFLLDAVVLPSPYAYAFGGFVEFITVVWWALGGVVASLFNVLQERWARQGKPKDTALPPDMSTMSLVGGGLIAGDSLAALSIGIYGLLTTVLK
jgi:hypothetical protein